MSWAFNVILGAFLLSMGSCKEEELVFPQQGDQETIVTETRPTARSGRRSRRRPARRAWR